MIIGITGTNGSGKDTAAAYLKQHDFTHYSLSEFIREELRKENKELTKENQIDKGNQLRKQHGPSILAKLALKHVESGKNYVITSIRNRHEIEELKKSGSFFLINLDADSLIRFQRTRQRHTATIDPDDFNQFLQNDQREAISEDGLGQELTLCAKLADATIRNDQSIEEFHHQLQNHLEQLQQRLHKRPNWDDYFLGVMEEIGKRATCDRGRSGSLIVKDKRILATGYVGAPPGLPHCDEVGHLLVDVHDENGTATKHCIRTTHAEQNALIQAARFGISLNGATIYCKMEPCHVCAKLIITAGITRVVAKKRYHAAQTTRELFHQAGVQLDVIDDTTETYKNM